jgi:hypothetical protein
VKAPPAWLEDFQARFGATIRTPLDRSTGTLTATPEAYDADLVALAARADRLAVYNRQYWFRLFEVMQGAFPLTARLAGFWTFNEWAAAFLLANPPRGWDIDDAADGLEGFLLETVPRDRDALVEAVRVDGAWRSVRRAPEVAPWRPTAADAERLPESRLLRSPAVAFVEETFPLLEIRAAVRADSRVTLPARLPRARSWALVRRDEGFLRIPLEDEEARLFSLLERHTLGEALARLEETCPPDARESLPDKTRAWLARSVEQGFWSGVELSRR